MDPATVRNEQLRRRIRALFVDSRVFGDWPSLRTGGGGIEFAKVTTFREGDPEEDLDPLASAQYGRPMRLLTHPSRRLDAVIVLDNKATMHFGSGEVTKADAAREALAACAQVLLEEGAGVSVMTKRGGAYLSVTYSRRDLASPARAGEALGAFDFNESDFSLSAALARLRHMGFTSSATVVVVVSDFIDAEPDYEAELRTLRRRKSEVVGLAVADPWELSPPVRFFGGILISDIGTGKRGFLEPPKDYLAPHQELFRRNSCGFEVITAEGGAS